MEKTRTARKIFTRFPASKKAKDDGEGHIRIIPLGGMEEVGRNMMVFEYYNPSSPYHGEIVIVDMGLQFPEENMPGIDFIIPNSAYLETRKNKIMGAIITHGHYDHIGAVPYLAKKLGNPTIYAAPLTKAIILKRQEEFPDMQKLNVKEITKDTHLKLGVFEIEFFHVNHNIFDTVGVAIKTPLGTIVHTADFKFDNSPVGDKPADYAKMAQLSSEGVLLLMSDSTNAEQPGHSISEKTIQENLERIFEHSKGRIITATFASLLSRVQQIIHLAEKYGRKVALDGYSMKTNVAIAGELGYLKAKKSTFIDLKDFDNYPADKVVLVATGAQGEENASLMRIALREHKYVRLHEGDTVIFSSSIVPGNERSVQMLKDVIYKQGAEVFHYQMMDIHAGGHAKAEDLKMMINLMRPKFFIPIQGNYYLLKLHGNLAESVGIPKENIAIPENGQVVKLKEEKIELTEEKVPANYIMVDGLGVGDVKEVVLRDRQMLAQDGIFVIITAIDSREGKVKGSPDIISRGFVYLKESQELLKQVRYIVRKIVEESSNMHPINITFVKDQMKERIGKFLFQKTKRRPMVLPVVIEI
ncbi:MAG: ribonuclease J [Candidatus Pacebacteria bacterium]|nr:ribonuclease J [Candidatus Paceibacterota bacterium]